jgi:hypothetical protein
MPNGVPAPLWDDAPVLVDRCEGSLFTALPRDGDGDGVGVGVAEAVIVGIGVSETDGDGDGVGDAGDTCAWAGTTMLPTIGWVHWAGRTVAPTAAVATICSKRRRAVATRSERS